jgi:hypothetical protein
MQKAFFFVAALASLPSETLGCVIDEVPAGWRDPPISVAPDCSFTEAGQGYYDAYSGAAAKDNGNGLVYQTFSRAGGCPGTTETLVVVDCNSREMIEIRGKEYPAADGFGYSVGDILAPKGAIRLNARTTIAKLEATSKRRGYDYGLDLLQRLGELRKRNRPDPYCGCRLFYPDSAGAKD